MAATGFELNVGQSELFGEKVCPDRPDLVEMVKRGFDHTAKNLVRNDEKTCVQVMEMTLRGISGRKIARACGVSRQSIRGIRQAMEERGIVEPLKKEISRLLGNFAAMGLEDMCDAVAEGRFHHAQLPVPVGIALTQKALVDGDPTVRIESGKPAELSVEAVRKFYEEMKRAKAVDVESSVKPEKTQ